MRSRGELAKRGQDSHNVATRDVKTLTDLGITRDQASKWDKLASLSKDDGTRV
jgi:hypothetical protein